MKGSAAAIAAAILTLLLLPSTARADAPGFPVFSSCSITASASRAPFAFNVHRTGDPALRFVATGGTDVVRGEFTGVRSYLVRTGESGRWQLWLVSGDWEVRPFLASDLELVVEPESADPLVVAPRVEGVGSIYALDAEKLTGEHAELAQLAYGFFKPGSAIKPGDRPLARAKLDLTRLKAALDWAKYLDAAQQAGSLACEAYMPRPFDVTNPLQYEECVVELTEPAKLKLTYASYGTFVDWMHSFVRIGWLGNARRASRSAAAERPGVSFQLDGVRMFANAPAVHGHEREVRLQLEGDLGRADFSLAEAYAGISVDAIGKLASSGTPVIFRLLAPDGSTLGEEALPAGTIEGFAAAYTLAASRAREMARDPMANCRIPEPIIVT